MKKNTITHANGSREEGLRFSQVYVCLSFFRTISWNRCS